ncbi:hypothetical protein ACFL20_03395 [Spirochaetota bacterium]
MILTISRNTVISLIIILIIAIYSPAQTQPSPEKISSKGGNFGIGISLGDPTGLSMKYYLNPKMALQGHVAWQPLHHKSGGLSVDFLWHPATILSQPEINLVPYLGGGTGFGLWEGKKDGDKTQFGLMLRMVLGFAIHWKKFPIDTVLEGGWTPFIIETDPGVFSPGHGDLSIKVRFYF